MLGPTLVVTPCVTRRRAVIERRPTVKGQRKRIVWVGHVVAIGEDKERVGMGRIVLCRIVVPGLIVVVREEVVVVEVSNGGKGRSFEIVVSVVESERMDKRRRRSEVVVNNIRRALRSE
jgi:hypothetical protein